MKEEDKEMDNMEIKTNLKTGKSDGIVTQYCNTISKKNKQFFINISKQKTK